MVLMMGSDKILIDFSEPTVLVGVIFISSTEICITYQVHGFIHSMASVNLLVHTYYVENDIKILYKFYWNYKIL